MYDAERDAEFSESLCTFLKNYFEIFVISLLFVLGKKLQTLWSNDYGRYLVAACDIPEKTEILLEGVLLHAPADDAKNGIAGTPVQLCLVCCRRTDRLCSSCKWHICSGNCEKVTNLFYYFVGGAVAKKKIKSTGLTLECQKVLQLYCILKLTAVPNFIK